MDDRMAVGAVHGRHDAIRKSRIACDADVVQDGACKPGKKPSTWFSQGPCLQGFFFDAARLSSRILGWRHSRHLRQLELRLAAFQAVTHFVPLALDPLVEAHMVLRCSTLTRLAGQKLRRPQRMGITQVRRLLPVGRHPPSLGVGGNLRCFARPRTSVEYRDRSASRSPL
jgi:hypothetical protein